MAKNILKSFWQVIADNRTKIILYVLPLITFIIGLIIPLLFIKKSNTTIGDVERFDLVDTMKMVLADGSTYDGSIIADSKKRQGFGRMTTVDGAVYEGNWDNDMLPYGKRITPSSVYRGKFDENFNNDGFGIIKYTDSYINGKRKQGFADCDIISVYIGNWRLNNKNGLGRSVKVDRSMDFGNYRNGIFQKMEGATYRVGGNIYGIDVSHYQSDINWDNLALFCDSNGNVYRGKPQEKKYMQPVFFAYIKATEGSTMKDNTYSIRAIEAERHGITKGAYHFLHLTSGIDEQVKNFLEMANWTEGDLPPALDIEVEQEIQTCGKDKLVAMTLSWLEKIEAKMHVRPIIYTRESIRNEYLNDSRLKKYDFWIAKYNDSGPNNFDWHFWQISETGVLNGYNDGRVDVDLFKGDYSAFMKYLCYKQFGLEALKSTRELYN